MKVNDKVIVRLNFRDEPGIVIAILPRGQVKVLTEDGDVRNWPTGSVRKLEDKS